MFHMEKKIRILHDYDNPYPRRSAAIKLGIKLILYGLLNKISIKINFINEIHDLARSELDLMIKLDKIVNVYSIIGIKKEIELAYPDIFNDLKKYEVDVREHFHEGDRLDPKRIRRWEPPLNLPIYNWNYDKKYVGDEKVMLNSTDIPVWHATGFNLSNYVNFLYNVLILNEKIYKDDE